MFDSKKKRFCVTEEEIFPFGAILVVDMRTGVNYLMSVTTGVTAITPLLDRDGQVVIDRVPTEP
ncbi:DUF6440 family protein [uncultured Intestinimonas sp.]|uniref:DUF6440 family protein n=1 Tax=uncultured Intestinimonas sp. TaxID=1689265 RepID=UPI0025DA8F96|nr:DUF6440 family protein [uncultured Intestinimonas sp.]